MLSAHKIAQQIPNKYLCSITQQIMLDPVITADGHTYERVAIEDWLKNHNTSPKTNLELSNKNLIPNIDKRSDIEEYLDQHPELREEVYFPEVLIINLTLAIKQQNLSEVKSILAKDKRVLDKLSPQGSTFWHLACIEGSTEILDEILSKLQDRHIALILDIKVPNNFKPIYANLLLETSLSNLDFKKADLLFKLGAELEQIDRNKNTLLHRLITQNKTEAITWLLNKNPNLEQINNEGNTPLLVAIQQSQPDIVKFLIEKGANTKTKNNKRSDAITLAAFMYYVETRNKDFSTTAFAGDILKLLNKDLANVPPLHLALKLNSGSLFVSCIEKGYSLEEKDIKGNTPLNLAIVINNIKAVDLLLKHGAQTTEIFHKAVINNNLPLFNKLLNFSDINAQDKEGNTALHLAAQRVHTDMVLTLLKAGASHKYLNHNGKNPIKVAIKAGNPAIAQLMIVTLAALKKEKANKLEQENKDKTAQIENLQSQIKNLEILLLKKTTIDNLVSKIKPEDLIYPIYFKMHSLVFENYH